ncbi:MAG: aconitate hydratase, partial [Bdellovibrionales bacterium]|nr:aconitate hydratase [Bdellovibrionales bacterium]
RMPQVMGIELFGELPEWVSAKDVILEMLRRHDVDGGVGKVIEYFGPGVARLSAMDRHVIANMGAELGATTTVFPSDESTKTFLASQNREDDWIEFRPDVGASYDSVEAIDLSKLEPLIALPSSPGNVVPVGQVEGKEIYQSYIGSSANPAYRDFAIAAEMVNGSKIPSHISFDINPTSRQILHNMVKDGVLEKLVNAGARIHQAGCNGCIGMGQAPATDKISLRTVPRNFPGRSGTKEDKVFLVSPETAAASALQGVITDPRNLSLSYPKVHDPKNPILDTELLAAPSLENGANTTLQKGPNIASLPKLKPLPNSMTLETIIKVGDDISTDEISPAGSRSLPFRSNIPKISEFCFEPIDASFAKRALALSKDRALLIVAGENYGQGSSREHAALCPRYLGVRIVLAKSFARIHRQNLVNFGIIPLTFESEQDYESVSEGQIFNVSNLHADLNEFTEFVFVSIDGTFSFRAIGELSQRQKEMLLAGGLINIINSKNK